MAGEVTVRCKAERKYACRPELTNSTTMQSKAVSTRKF